MTHRHITGEKLSEFFVVQQNSDLTEGRGGMQDVNIFTDHKEAYKAARGRAVQGCGDGNIVLRKYHRCEECPEILKVDKIIYIGDTYSKKNLLGKGQYINFMSDGWHMDYSEIANDPEYQEYLRLRKKFENA